MKQKSVEQMEKDLRRRGLWSAVEEVAAQHFLLPEEILGRTKTATVCKARAILWSRLKEQTQFSYPEMGMLFGRDHSTVMMAVKEVGRSNGKGKE
jgi:chromosomal replication initiator protein